MFPPPNSLVYLAGPMRGIHHYNFPAFDAAETTLKRAGMVVLSPAAMDREIGFYETKDEATPEFLAAAMRRDIYAILRADALILLPGWDASTGATAEAYLARWRGIPCYVFPSYAPVTFAGVQVNDPNEDILDEAKRLTGGDRNRAYGHPAKNFGQTAALWNALKPGVDFTAKDVAMFMIAVKLSREMHSPRRDTLVDIAGYARCADFCQKPDEPM